MTSQIPLLWKADLITCFQNQKRLPWSQRVFFLLLAGNLAAWWQQRTTRRWKKKNICYFRISIQCLLWASQVFCHWLQVPNKLKLKNFVENIAQWHLLKQICNSKQKWYRKLINFFIYDISVHVLFQPCAEKCNSCNDLTYTPIW